MKFISKSLFLIVFINSFLFAQVGINTTFPNAALDVSSLDSGVLVPRVALTSLNVATPVINPQGGSLIVGTIVWNTNTSGLAPNNVTPGFYYWNGTSWQTFSNSSKIENYSSSIAVPNASIPGVLGSLTSVGINSTASSFDNFTVTRTINVTGVTGTIGNISCNVRFSHTWASDVDIYLQSPSGQIIELTTDNGGTGATTFNVTFSDTGSQNITSWAGGSVTGTYRPEGTLASDVISPNITNMSGFNGFSPNGTWTLHMRDDLAGDSFTFTSFSISVATYGTSNFRLIAEHSLNYSDLNKYSIDSNYSANVVDNAGAIIALTRTNTSAGALGTTVTTLPGTILNYSSDSPSSGSGNFWISTNTNHVENTALTNGIYYYQLWSKANIESPTSNNEIYSFKITKY